MGNQGGGTQVFDTNFVPKACSTITTTDLPHLSAAQVSTIASNINSVMGSSTLCVAVWGHLVLSNIPDSNNFVNTAWTKLYANIVANILDRDADGRVDDSAVEGHMQTKANGHYTIARAATMTDEQEEGFQATMGKSTAVKEDHEFTATSQIKQSVGSSTEEIFHTYQHALGAAHPTIFGVIDSGSGCSDRRAALGEGSIDHGYQGMAGASVMIVAVGHLSIVTGTKARSPNVPRQHSAIGIPRNFVAAPPEPPLPRQTSQAAGVQHLRVPGSNSTLT